MINLFKVEIRLHVPWDPTFYYIYLSNKNQMYIPRADNLFGSDTFNLDTSGSLRKSGTTEFLRYYKIRRLHWNALDSPEKRCDMVDTEANTTRCLTQHMEETVGCSMGLTRSNPRMERCKANILALYLPKNVFVFLQVQHD